VSPRVAGEGVREGGEEKQVRAAGLFLPGEGTRKPNQLSCQDAKGLPVTKNGHKKKRKRPWENGETVQPSTWASAAVNKKHRGP